MGHFPVHYCVSSSCSTLYVDLSSIYAVKTSAGSDVGNQISLGWPGNFPSILIQSQNVLLSLARFRKPLDTKGDGTVCHHLKSFYSVLPLKQQTLAATIYCFLIYSQPIISLRMCLISKDASSRHCRLHSSNCALGDIYFCLPCCMFVSFTGFTTPH